MNTRSMQSNEPAVAVEKVSKSYGQQAVLNQLDWRIEPGTIVGLLGVNGAGKSTLLNTVVGIAVPEAGTIRVYGEDPRRFSVPVKHRIGYVPQSSEDFPWLRVRELLQLTASFYDRWNHDKIESLRDRWSLDAKAKVGALSVGQRQRLSILRALGHDPDLLILDEPVASLDPAGRRDFLREVLDLASRDNKTVIFSTHITSDLERVAARVALLHNGRILLDQDIDTTKEQVVKLHIRGSHELPEQLTVANAIHVKVNGRQAIATVRDIDAGTITRMETELRAVVTQQALSLEDIFLELTQ